MLHLLDLLAVSWRQIKSRFLESAMVVLGIALGVGIISGALALVSAYRQDANTSLNRPQMREIQVSPAMEEGGIKYGGEMPAVTKLGTVSTPQITLNQDDLKQAKAECPEVDYAYIANFTHFFIGDAPKPSGKGGMMIMIQKKGAGPQAGEASGSLTNFMARAVTPDFFPAYGLELAAGSLFTQADIDAGLPVIALGAGLARRLFPAGDPVGARLRLNGIEFKVIGVMKPYIDPSGEPQDLQFGQDYQAYVPLANFGGKAGMLRSIDGAAGSLTFAVRDAASLRPAVNQLQNYFTRKYGAGTVAIASGLDWTEQNAREIVPVLTVVGCMAGCGLLIAALNILNLMVARVIRRGKNIGIAVALGASRAIIFRSYLCESLLLGASGGLLGLGAAYGLTGLLRGILTQGQTGAPAMNLTWQVLAIAALTTLAVNLIFGVYPAFRAARSNPVDALRMD